VSAKLRVFAYAGTADGPAVYSVGNGWLERGITWSNRPARTSGATDDKGSIATDSWVEYDVRPFITGSGSYSFVLATSSNDGVDFRSREYTDASQRPELVVSATGGDAGTPSAPAPPPVPGPPGMLPPSLTGPPVSAVQAVADRTAPKVALSGLARQRLARSHLSVLARCDEPCTITGSASVRVGGASATVRSAQATRWLGAGVQAKLPLSFSRKAALVIRRRLAHRRLLATVKIVCRDAAGNIAIATRTIRIRR
jgi:hypothetical protein